jgi:hypothetical protein
MLYRLVVALIAANTLNSSHGCPSLDCLMLRVIAQKFLRNSVISCLSSDEHIVFDPVVCAACHFIIFVLEHLVLQFDVRNSVHIRPLL